MSMLVEAVVRRQFGRRAFAIKLSNLLEIKSELYNLECAGQIVTEKAMIRPSGYVHAILSCEAIPSTQTVQQATRHMYF